MNLQIMSVQYTVGAETQSENTSVMLPPINISKVEKTSEQLLEERLGPVQREMPLVILLLTLYTLIFVSGLFGNLTTCYVIRNKSYMRTTTNYYLLSLAISDLLTLLIGLPTEAYSIWESYPWRFGKAFCIIKALFVEMTSYASVLTITAFTVERYIAICKPLKTHKIVAFSRCIKIIVGIWLISLCCALPYPIHTELYFYVETAEHKPIQDSLQCNIPPRYYDRMSYVFQISTFVFFVLPLTVIIVLYSMIGVALRKADVNRNSSERCHQTYQRHNSTGQQDKCPTSLSTRCVLRILVVVAFFVSWAPFHAQRLLTVYNKHWTPLTLDIQSFLFYISGVLYFVGSTVNPILYNVMSRRYRLAFLETICRINVSDRHSSGRATNGTHRTSQARASFLRYPIENQRSFGRMRDSLTDRQSLSDSQPRRVVRYAMVPFSSIRQCRNSNASSSARDIDINVRSSWRIQNNSKTSSYGSTTVPVKSRSCSYPYEQGSCVYNYIEQGSNINMAVNQSVVKQEDIKFQNTNGFV